MSENQDTIERTDRGECADSHEVATRPYAAPRLSSGDVFERVVVMSGASLSASQCE